MTTRPGYVWDATASEWIEIGQAAVVAPIAYQTSAPVSPATGDIWIDSDDEVPSVDSTLYYRWTKTMSGGETSLSGTDNNSLALKYTPGYESVFINGVLQVRGSDYLATTGTTVTGLTALVSGDIVMVESIVAYSVGDTYTQTQSDARFVNKNVGGLNLVVPTSVTGGTLATNGAITFSASSGVSVNGCFNTTYDNYRMILNITSKGTTANTNFRFRVGGTDNTASSYNWTASYYLASNNFQSYRTTSASLAQVWNSIGQDKEQASMEIYGPNLAATTAASISGSHGAGDINWNGSLGHSTSTQFDGFTIYPSTGTLTGTIRIYGYNNGA